MKHLAWPAMGRAAGRVGLLLLAIYLAAAGGKFAGRVLYPSVWLNGLLMAVGGLAWLVWRRVHRRPFPATLLDGPLLFWLVGCVFSTLASESPRLSLEPLLYTLACVLVFYLLVDLQRAGKSLETWLAFTLLGGIWFLAYGWQEIGRWYVGWLAIGGWADPFPPATIRVQASMGHPNVLAAYLNLLWPLAGVRLLTVRRGWQRAVLALGVILAWGLVFFTSSRGGWLGTAAALGTLVLLLGLDHPGWLRARWDGLRRRRWLLAATVLAVLAVLAAGGWLLARQAQHPSHPSGNPRAYIWAVALDMFRQHPLLGTGPGTYPLHFLRTYSIPPGALLPHAHNGWLNLLGENGLWGVVGGLGLALVLAWAAWRQWRTQLPGERAHLVGSLAALVGLAVHGLFEVPQVAPMVNLLTALLAAQLLASLAPRRPAGRWAGGALAATWLATVGLGAFVLWGYAAYQRGLDAAGLGRWPEAVRWLDEAARRDPQMPLYHIEAGVARGRAAQAAAEGTGTVDPAELARAIQQLKAGLALQGNYAADWAELAALEQAAGDWAGAVDANRRAVDLAPQSLALRLGLGQALEQAGRAGEARNLYIQVLAEEPSLAQTDFFAGSELRREAAAQLPAQPRDPTDGWQALVAGEPARAEVLFRQALAVNDAQDYLGLSLALAAQGKADEAAQAQAVARFIDPQVIPPAAEREAAVAPEDLALIYLRQGLPQDAGHEVGTP